MENVSPDFENTVLRADHAGPCCEHYPNCLKTVHPTSHCGGTNKDKPGSPRVLYCTTVCCGGENCRLIISSIYPLNMRCKQKQIKCYCNAVKQKFGLIRGILISYRVILSKSWCTTVKATFTNVVPL